MVDEIRLAEMADKIEEDWRQEPDTFQLHCHDGITEREAELLTEELRRRGVAALVQPMTEEHLKPIMKYLGLNE